MTENMSERSREIREAFKHYDQNDLEGNEARLLIRIAAGEYADLIKSGPIPASQCIFPLVKEEILVYPTDQRRSYDVALRVTEDVR